MTEQTTAGLLHKRTKAAHWPERNGEPSGDAVFELSNELRRLLADVLTLYIKTKSFHWHMSGKHFRDYHLLLDEQAEQLHAMVDVIAERTRKIGAPAIFSIGDIARLQRLRDNDQALVSPDRLLTELRSDNQQLTRFLRTAHEVCGRFQDYASASFIDDWIDESELRTWFLAETQLER